MVAITLVLAALLSVSQPYTAAAALLPRQQAQSSYSAAAQSSADALIQDLRTNNLNALADAFQNYPDAVLRAASSPGPKTLLAPINSALSNETFFNVNTDIPNTLSYHFLNGTIPTPADQLASSPFHTVLHSFLVDSKYASIPGGNGQAVALSSGGKNKTGQINQAINTVNYAGDPASFTSGDFTVEPISQALSIPGSATYTMTSVTRRSFSATASDYLPSVLNDMRGVTLFVPSDEAVQAFLDKHPNLSHDDANAVVLNHLVENRVVYSPLLIEQGSMITMSGQDIFVSSSAKAAGSAAAPTLTVNVGGASATITQTDVMHHGGVIHLIDTVLYDERYDQGRAAAARLSALLSANSFVSGPVSVDNTATSQGVHVPASPPNTPAAQQAQNSTAPSTFDATQGGQTTIPLPSAGSGDGASGGSSSPTTQQRTSSGARSLVPNSLSDYPAMLPIAVSLFFFAHLSVVL